MSNLMSNTEIEDILTSIRRLVSEDGRSAPGPTPGQSLAGAGRLVLTPALRVAASRQAASEVQDDEVPEADNDEIPEPAQNAPEAMVEAGVFDESLTEELPGESPDQAAAPKQVTDDWQPEALASPADTRDWRLEASGTADIDDAPPQAPIGARIAELEAAVAARQEEWDPDGSEKADKAQSVSFASARFVHSKSVRAPAEADTDDSEGALPWQDDEEETARDPAPRHRTSDDDATGRDDSEGMFDADDEMAVLDEEALREMVQDIIRHELQGTLGERITRNVRKLVRAEIRRALAARDFN